ncbi:LppU/SCO3897 family protein [Salinispora arenicola]|uniref:LppU/SCO3897 family protein n=1 Tax=Salinispora arenicola TaxID=168697 RepID=UPI000576EF4D|nr:hypothetical protein [Salinispora arenicola]
MWPKGRERGEGLLIVYGVVRITNPFVEGHPVPEQVKPSAEPDATPPDMQESDDSQPGVQGSDVPKPEASQSDVEGSGVHGSDVPKPEASQSDVEGSGVHGSDVPKPEASQSDVEGSGVHGSDAPEPDAPKQSDAQGSSSDEEPVRKSGAMRVFGIVGVIVVFLVIAGLKFGVGSAIGEFFNPDETADAKVGDCLGELPEVVGAERERVDGASVVECTSTEATYAVVGRADGQTEEQAHTGEACDPFFKEGEENYVFSNIPSGGTGYLLCLTKKS